MLRISELAKLAGVKVSTLRFYERYGLLPKPQVNQSGYRKYLPAVALRVRFIRNAQVLGFTLEEIGELLDLQNNVAVERHTIKLRASNKIKVIENKIKALTKVKESLQQLHDCCPGHGSIDLGCPILEALGSEKASELLLSPDGESSHDTQAC